MAVLLDVNVLIALAWPNHVHHAAAVAWFTAHRDGGWATCPVTESGFVRVSSNTHVIPEAKRPAEAIAVLRALTALNGHRFWSDDVSFCQSSFIAPARIVSHGQVTDAHLVALALHRQGRLATFDRRMGDVVPAHVDVAGILLLLS
ncbi:MAG: PIN domain-containing protein [Gemmatimonadetes bacterium]|nr:PIN domain-containing protein [Gemmatimonadota bacterium]